MSEKNKVDDTSPISANGEGEVDIAVGESHKTSTNHLGLLDGEHIFSDPNRARYWRGVYERANYEGRRRFDPELTWPVSAERLLIRKVFENLLCSDEAHPSLFMHESYSRTRADVVLLLNS